VPGDAELAEFNASWAAGRNFVTNGPMVFFSTTSGKRPGDTLALSSGGGRVSFKLSIHSDQTLTSAEIVVNGEVVQRFDVSGKRQFSGSGDLEISEGSWIAASCTAVDGLLNDDELSVYRWGADDHRMRQRPSRLRFAHTSPIYCTVDGRGPAVPESIEEGLAMLDQFERFVRRTAEEKYMDETTKAVQRARAILQERQKAE
jgi:hypothetical protein